MWRPLRRTLADEEVFIALPGPGKSVAAVVRDFAAAGGDIIGFLFLAYTVKGGFGSNQRYRGQ